MVLIAALLLAGVSACSNAQAGSQEEPRLFYMHFWANDDAETLTEGLRAALDETNSA